MRFPPADLQLRFDGYLNLLAGVYIRPTAATTATADAMVQGWITDAETRATTAGKAFGITAGSIQNLATIQRTFDNYKPVKEAIVELCDNIEGAGQFDVIFNPDRSYDITNQLGRNITSWNLYYPAHLAGQGITSISAQESMRAFATDVALRREMLCSAPLPPKRRATRNFWFCFIKSPLAYCMQG